MEIRRCDSAERRVVKEELPPRWDTAERRVVKEALPHRSVEQTPREIQCTLYVGVR